MWPIYICFHYMTSCKNSYPTFAPWVASLLGAITSWPPPCLPRPAFDASYFQPVEKNNYAVLCA